MEPVKENPVPRRIYLDTNILVGWFKSQLSVGQTKSKLIDHLRRFGPRNPDVIKFLINHRDIEKFISIFTIAEIVHVLKYSDEFKGYDLELATIKWLMELLQEAVGFSVIKEVSLGGNSIKGVIISPDIVDFVDKHSHIIDCIHIDIAKHNELTFVSNERDLGKMKDSWRNNDGKQANQAIRIGLVFCCLLEYLSDFPDAFVVAYGLGRDNDLDLMAVQAYCLNFPRQYVFHNN